MITDKTTHPDRQKEYICVQLEAKLGQKKLLGVVRSRNLFPVDSSSRMNHMTCPPDTGLEIRTLTV